MGGCTEKPKEEEPQQQQEPAPEKESQVSPAAEKEASSEPREASAAPTQESAKTEEQQPTNEEAPEEGMPRVDTDFSHGDESHVVGRNILKNDEDNENNADEPSGPTASSGAADNGEDAPPSSAPRKESSATKEGRHPDPFDLRRRFLKSHRHDFDQALREIKNGRKCSCWSWYIFPTAPWVVNGFERGSYTNQQYALRDLPPNNLRGDDAARAYLRFPEEHGVNLRQNYIDMMREVTRQVADKGISVRALVGGLDDPKLRSSVRLFERISRDGFDDEVNDVCKACLVAMKEDPEE